MTYVIYIPVKAGGILSKEVFKMPGRDGTGPMGRGEATGRRPQGGFGRGIRAGAGFGFGRGMGFCRPILTEAEEKEWLKQEREMLKEELDYIEQALGSQSDETDGK